jgi:hypothetical protein
MGWKVINQEVLVMLKKLVLPAIAAAAVAFLPATAMAKGGGGGLVATGPSPTSMAINYMTFNVAGIQSFDSMGASGNAVYTMFVGAGAEIMAIGWDVNITAISPSWQSEMGVVFSDSMFSDTWVSLRPGNGANSSGTGSFSSGGPVDLVELGYSFTVGSDGMLRLEFFESYDDAVGAADGFWNSGTLTIGVSAVPEPGTYGLMALGLLGIALVARRRRAD